MKHEVIYMTAEQLGLTDAEYAGLLRIKGELERGDLRHVSYAEMRGKSISGFLFNMDRWVEAESCGTVCCIGGWLETRGQLSNKGAVRLDALFYPRCMSGAFSRITSAQAARAIGNLLTTGEPRWAECVA